MNPDKSNKMQVKDLVTIGIFSAIYFIINLIVMICGGITPLLWVFMPPILSVLCGVIYMLLVAKVQKTGAVLIMGLITGLIYVATGQFTLVLLVTFGLACVVAELIRKITGYNNFAGNLWGYAFFSLGMVGSPLPIWLFRDSFSQQMVSQGFPSDYVETMNAVTPIWVLIVMIVATFLLAFVGGMIGKALMKKHFEKAGMV